MLKSIADFSIQGRWQAVITITALSLLATLLSPIAFLASGVIVLITLRMGPSEGARVLAIAIVAFMILTWLLIPGRGEYFLVWAALAASWMPVFFATLALGYSRSLSVGLLAITGMGLLLVVGAHLLIPDLNGWWQTHLKAIIQSMSESAGGAISEEKKQLLLAQLPSLLNATIIASLMINTVMGLLLGRSWQARLDSPGSFGEEFRSISFGRSLALVMMVLFAVVMSPLSATLPWLKELLLVLSLTFLLQTLAIIHFWAKQRNSKLMLILVYGLLILMLGQVLMSPIMMLVVPLLGILDEWVNFRKREIA